MPNSTHPIFLHIDMNSYFASVEQQANPFLRGKPIGITGKQQQRSIIATASVEAKRLGVKTAMSTWEAMRVCPSLIIYPGDPEKYSDLMHRFNTVYREFTDSVEEFSVDESFLDLTEHTPDYLGAVSIALCIRERINEELGEHITASIGIAPNKLMAKLSSERVKPNGLTVTPPEKVIELLDKSLLSDLCGIGPRIEYRLNQLGIFNFEQLRNFPLHTLVSTFKTYGFWMHEAAWGRELDSVTTVKRARDKSPKSYGHSYTLPCDTTSTTEMRRCLLGLCDKVAWRMRRDGCAARRVTVYIRYGDFSSMGQQKILNEPIDDGFAMYKTAWRLVETWRDDTKSVRLLGVSASHLLPTDKQQQLFKKDQKMRALRQTLDQLQKKYGQCIWTRTSLLQTTFKARSSGFHFDHEI